MVHCLLGVRLRAGEHRAGTPGQAEGIGKAWCRAVLSLQTGTPIARLVHKHLKGATYKIHGIVEARQKGVRQRPPGVDVEHAVLDEHLQLDGDVDEGPLQVMRGDGFLCREPRGVSETQIAVQRLFDHQACRWCSSHSRHPPRLLYS
ncbi:FAD-binding protein [Babesia caballi]|uniref:FAD-binding protein n=1 Tax=Babesia caballi TaxID=5871 RepID=A0AAV4LUK1_BABCB|nr:FAD-binding protein [Babesia caballi]